MTLFAGCQINLIDVNFHKVPSLMPIRVNAGIFLSNLSPVYYKHNLTVCSVDSYVICTTFKNFNNLLMVQAIKIKAFRGILSFTNAPSTGSTPFTDFSI